MHLENEGSRAVEGYKWARKLCLILLQTPSSLLWTFISPPSGDTAFCQVQAKKPISAISEVDDVFRITTNQAKQVGTNLNRKKFTPAFYGRDFQESFIHFAYLCRVLSACCLLPKARRFLCIEFEPWTKRHDPIYPWIGLFLMLDNKLCQLNVFFCRDAPVMTQRQTGKHLKKGR